MSSFLSGIKKALISDDTPKPADQSANAKVAPEYVPPTSDSSTVLAAQGVLDVPNITKDIEQQITNNPSYALYKKFEDQLEILKTVPGMDEATRFRASAATVGAAPADLIAALNSHGVVLADSATRFESVFIVAGKGALENLKHEIEAAEQKVKDLTDQLGAASQAKTDLVNASQQRAVDLGKADVDFKGIVAALSTKYRDRAAKVQQHLGVGNAK